MTLSAFNTRTQLLILPPLFPFFCACSVTVKEKMSYFRNGQRMEAQHCFNLLVTTIQSPSLLLCSLEGMMFLCRSNLRYLSVHKAADPRGFDLDGAAISPRPSWDCPPLLSPQSEEGSSGLEVLSLCRLYSLSWSPTYIKQLLVLILNEFSFFRVCPHILVYRRDKKCVILTVRGALLALKFN